MSFNDPGTLTERAGVLIEAAIVKGQLQPGSKLPIAKIAGDFGISQTPMREALSRLVSRGLVTAVGQRGFRVAPVSSDDLADITFTRIALEAAALRQSMRVGGGQWEGTIVSTLHQMKRIAGGSKILQISAELDRVHKDLHAALIAACGSPRVIELAGHLYDQAHRYRSIMLRQSIKAQDFVSEHERLVDVVLSRAGDGAVARLSHHLERTYRDIYAAPMGSKTERKPN